MEKIKMLTINEAADMFDGLTKFRIRELCKSGVIPCLKAGKKYLINQNVLLKYIAGNTL